MIVLRVAASFSVHAGRTEDPCPRVDVLMGVDVPVPGRNLDGERQVRADLPEGDERDPAHRRDDVVTRRLREPVGAMEDEPGTPPHDRVGRVLDVQHPRPVGRHVCGRNSRPGSVLNRTVRPPRYTGVTSGVPGSRPSTNSRYSVLKFGGPAKMAPAVRLRRSYSPLNAVSPPNDPRLSPTTTSAGRRSTGSLDQRSYTASNSCPARLPRAVLIDQVGQPRREIGVLHRHRRGVAAGHVLDRINRARVDPPEPVAVTTTRVPPAEPAGPC